MREEQITVYETPSGIPEADYIHGKAILLRPLTLSDTEDILRWRNTPYVREHFVFRDEMTKQMHEAWLLEKVMKGVVRQWIICETDAREAAFRAVGSVYLRDIDQEVKTAEYGIFIGETDALGKGYAVEAARLVLQYAFQTLHLQTVGLRVYSDNERAKRGYAAAGFREVRSLPDVISTDGSRADMLWMEAKPGI